MNPPADFAYWDTVQSFTLTEAAWLWCGLEPPDDGLEFMPKLRGGISPHPKIRDLTANGFQSHPKIPGLPARGHRAARAMWLDITQSRLVILTDGPDRRYRIPRTYLCVWAGERGEVPRFLSPAPPKKPRVTDCQHEYDRWKQCAATIQEERARANLRPLNKVGVAIAVIDRLDLDKSSDWVKRQL